MVTTFTYKHSLVTDPPYTHKETNTPTHAQTDRTDYNTLRR